MGQKQKGLRFALSLMTIGTTYCVLTILSTSLTMLHCSLKQPHEVSMIIKSILHAREQAQRKVCAPSKHQECLNQRHREVPGPPPSLPLLSLLSRPLA